MDLQQRADNGPNRLPFLLLTLLLSMSGCSSRPEMSADIPADANRLVTGKYISPATQPQRVGNMPMNMIATADGKFAITCDMGYREALWSIRTVDGVAVSHVDYKNPKPKASTRPSVGGEDNTTVVTPGSPRSNGLYYGLAAAKDGTIFAAQGNHDSIAVLHLDDAGVLSSERSIKTKTGDFPAGLALDEHDHLFVANNTAGGDPFRSPGSVSIYQASTGKPLGRCELPSRFAGTSGFPLGLTVLPDGSRAFVDCERDDAVYAIDSTDASSPKVIKTIDVGEHPVGVVLSHDTSRVYVANSESDTISVIDTATLRVSATILLRPEVARGLRGCTPVALSISPDDRTLYAALADMNAIAIIDLAAHPQPMLTGYLPTGWYPSAALATSDGKHLLIVDAKGSRAMNPNGALDPVATTNTTQPTLKSSAERRGYVEKILEGDVRRIELPDDADDLKRSTAEVLKNNRLPLVPDAAADHVASMGLASGRIEHVIYVIKENRSYDQVFGDLPRGNGDPSLTIFGRTITPNLHALADRFVLLDNCYCCGDVSGDGWNWSTQGMADAYVQRNIPYSYSQRGRKFDFEGANNGYVTGGFPSTGPDAPATTNPSMAHGAETIPDVANNGMHLWDLAKAAGVSFRNYGFYLSVDDDFEGVKGGPDNYPTAIGLRPGGHDLAGVTDLDYRRFDLDFADSDAPENYFKQTNDAHCLFARHDFGKSNMPCRIAEWRREFELMLQKDQTGAGVPALTLLRMPNDHTSAMKAGKHAPASMVADNDYAIGELVDTISHSPIWKSTAIVIIEDDAQSGEDHVDAHRTTCLVVSPWIRKGAVDHHFYNTDSVLKTMELLLGLGPMTQYEAIATPINDWENKPENSEPFDAFVPNKDIIAAINPKAEEMSAADPRRRLVQQSGEMDFTHEDRAPTALLNEIVWKSVRGVDAIVPPPVESPLQPAAGAKKDDDD